MNNQLRKAAILVASLDKASAEALLAQMPKAIAQRVLAAAKELGPIDPREQQEVLSDFARQSGKPLPPSPAPNSFSQSLSAASSSSASEFAASEAEGVELELSSSAVSAPATYSEGARPKHRFAYVTAELVEPLATLLTREQPQLAALILAHLPPERSAAVLAKMEPDYRLPIVQRIAEIEEPAPDVLEAIELELEPRLMRERLQVEGSQHGLAALSGILQASDVELRKQISSAIGARKAAKAVAKAAAVVTPEETEAVSAPQREFVAPPAASKETSVSEEAPAPSPPQESVIAFADLNDLDDISLAAVFGAVSPQVALLALVGAEETLVKRILRILPRKEAALFRRRLEEVGPLRLKEVELAQAKMSHAAGDLLQQRRITLPSTQRVRLAA